MIYCKYAYERHTNLDMTNSYEALEGQCQKKSAKLAYVQVQFVQWALIMSP